MKKSKLLILLGLTLGLCSCTESNEYKTLGEKSEDIAGGYSILVSSVNSTEENTVKFEATLFRNEESKKSYQVKPESFKWKSSPYSIGGLSPVEFEPFELDVDSLKPIVLTFEVNDSKIPYNKSYLEFDLSATTVGLNIKIPAVLKEDISKWYLPFYYCNLFLIDV